MRIVLGLILLGITAVTQATVHCDGSVYQINQCLIQSIKQADLALVHKHHLSVDKVARFKKMRQSMCSWMVQDIKGTYGAIYYGYCELSLTQWYVENQSIH